MEQPPSRHDPKCSAMIQLSNVVRACTPVCPWNADLRPCSSNTAVVSAGRCDMSSVLSKV